MKKFPLAILVLLVSLARLDADEVLENGDFLDGITHWDGNGHLPSEFAPPTPLDPPSPYGSDGMIIPLKDHDWVKVSQDFHTKFANLILRVTYKLSSDIAFSTSDQDYQNVTHQIGWDFWPPFSTPRGTWMVFSSDPNSYRFVDYSVVPKTHSTDEQTYRVSISDLVLDDTQTICFAFPPGKGAVILLRVSLKDK